MRTCARILEELEETLARRLGAGRLGQLRELLGALTDALTSPT